jgi:hypothetical protein
VPSLFWRCLPPRPAKTWKLRTRNGPDTTRIEGCQMLSMWPLDTFGKTW